MNNDKLINEARQLYAELYIQQYAKYIKNKSQFDRLDRLVEWSYCRYQRRLNRCIFCYQRRDYDCTRDAFDPKQICQFQNSNSKVVNPSDSFAHR